MWTQPNEPGACRAMLLNLFQILFPDFTALTGNKICDRELARDGRARVDPGRSVKELNPDRGMREIIPGLIRDVSEDTDAPAARHCRDHFRRHLCRRGFPRPLGGR